MSGEGRACETALLLAAGARLRYSQETTARAVVFFYRLLPSFGEGDADLLAATCLFLAGKAAETPRRVRDVVNASQRSRDAGAAVAPLDDGYFQRKAAVIDAEQRALRLLGFDLEAATPHRLALTLAHALRCDGGAAQVALALANDSLFSATCRALPPVAVAAAAVDVALEVEGAGAARDRDRDDPQSRLGNGRRRDARWHARFGASDADVAAARGALLDELDRALPPP